jgi:hypothetical protein
MANHDYSGDPGQMAIAAQRVWTALDDLRRTKATVDNQMVILPAVFDGDPDGPAVLFRQLLNDWLAEFGKTETQLDDLYDALGGTAKTTDASHQEVKAKVNEISARLRG